LDGGTVTNLKRFNYYGPEWQLIRRLARERDEGQCRLSYSVKPALTSSLRRIVEEKGVDPR